MRACLPASRSLSKKHEGQSSLPGQSIRREAFSFRAEKVGSDTLLAQIIRMVREAQGSKAPIQHLADRIAGIFVPVVISVAMLSGLIWYFSGADNRIDQSLLSVVTVLIIACPVHWDWPLRLP